jgi:anhydro-N-acetylmuramic acid kinase
MSKRKRIIAGCMTGTSLDALDVALVRVEGEGLQLKAELIGGASADLGPLRAVLLALARGEAMRPAAILQAARHLGLLHAQTIAVACEQVGAGKLDLVAAHGQTICHQPRAGQSWQLLDPWPIVRKLGVPVVYDLRQADLIAGGQGAPITPLSDWIMFRDDAVSRLVVNLGGICNVTSLPAGCEPGEIDGNDVCPCNLLLDGLAQRLIQQPFDADGAFAAGGQPDDAVHDRLEANTFARGAAAESMGREDISDAWLDKLVSDLGRRMSPADLMASAVEAVAMHVCADLPQYDEIILAGGGAHNGYLVSRITELCEPAAVLTSDALGVPIEAREAMALAVLGALSQDGVPITLEQITGADNPGRAGCWAYP